MKPIRRLSGTVATATPAVCFWVVGYFQPTYFLYANGFKGYKWLPLEESIAIICVLLYLYKRWPVSVWTTVGLLALHSSLWYRSYAVTFAGGHANLLAIPIVAGASLPGVGLLRPTQLPMEWLLAHQSTVNVPLTVLTQEL